MRNEPVLSVCIPCYNAAKHVRECIDSILSQSFTDFELVIVDDGCGRQDATRPATHPMRGA